MTGSAADGFVALGENKVFGGHLFSVAEARFQDPEGHEFERDVVHHPGAVAVVALEPSGTVVLVRQFRPAVGTAVLELPAGTRDVDGEPMEETARRELGEEAGLEASDVELLATVFNSPGYTDQRTAIFLATGLRSRATRRAGVEERWMEVERVALDDVPALVAAGRLQDATTVAGLMLTTARQQAVHRGLS